MVISATARAAAKILAKSKTVRRVRRRVKQRNVIKTSKLLPNPPVKRKLVKDILREGGSDRGGRMATRIESMDKGDHIGVDVGLLRGGKLKSIEPQKPQQQATAAEWKRYHAQVAQQKKAGSLYRDFEYPTGVKYGLGVDRLEWDNLRGTDMPYQLKNVTDKTTLPVMSFFGKTKGFKTKKTLSGKKYRAEIEADAEMGRQLDDHITGGGDGNAWSPPGGSEVYAIYNKQGVVTRYDSMYWGSGRKKSLRDIKELVQSGKVSYTKWKKAPDTHPQVARIEKAGKSTRMIKMSGKEGKARGELMQNPYGVVDAQKNLQPETHWAFIQTGDTWMDPESGMGFPVGYPTPKALARMGVKGPAFKRQDKEITKAKKQKRSNAAQRQVALMEKDIARANEARVKLQRQKVKKLKLTSEQSLGLAFGGVGVAAVATQDWSKVGPFMSDVKDEFGKTKKQRKRELRKFSVDRTLNNMEW